MGLQFLPEKLSSVGEQRGNEPPAKVCGGAGGGFEEAVGKRDGTVARNSTSSMQKRGWARWRAVTQEEGLQIG